MTAMWIVARRLSVMLLAVAAGATSYLSFAGVWALDLAKSDLGQCREVEHVMIRVEYTTARVTVVELFRDELGDHVRKREFTLFRRAGNTIQLQAEQPNQVAVLHEQWTLSSNGNRLSIQRKCGQPVQRLVFRRSTMIPE